MKSMKEYYEHATHSEYAKARVFLPIQMVLATGFLGVAVSKLLARGIYISPFIDLTAVVIFAINAVRTFRGRLDQTAFVSLSILSSLLILVAASDSSTGALRFAQESGVISGALFLGSFFIASRRQMFWFGILVPAAFAAMVAIVAAMGDLNIGNISLADALVTPIFYLFGAGGVSILMHRVMEDNNKRLEEQYQSVLEAREANRVIIRGVAEGLDESARLSESASETASATVEIERNVASISARIAEAGKRFEQARAGLGKVASEAERLLGLVDRQLRAVELSGKSIDEMAETTQEVAATISSKYKVIEGLRATAVSGRQVIETFGTSFAEVRELMQGIEEMTGLIRGMAGQTNLLAMNAAIEAAHAGDAGKGFAVVASEIRNLAESSAESVATIENNLKRLTEAIRSAGSSIGSVDEAFARVDGDIGAVEEAMKDISESTRNLDSGSSSIQQAMAELSEAATGVRTEANGVTAAQRGVSADIEAVGRVVDEIVAGMGEIDAGARDIRSSVGGLRDLAEEIRAHIARLKELGTATA